MHTHFICNNPVAKDNLRPKTPSYNSELDVFFIQHVSDADPNSSEYANRL